MIESNHTDANGIFFRRISVGAKKTAAWIEDACVRITCLLAALVMFPEARHLTALVDCVEQIVWSITAITHEAVKLLV